MTKHERFLNVLANKPVDRVPVAFFHHFLEDWTDFGKGIEDDEVFEKIINGNLFKDLIKNLLSMYQKQERD